MQDRAFVYRNPVSVKPTPFLFGESTLAAADPSKANEIAYTFPEQKISTL
jgi:hypothetical protein